MCLLIGVYEALSCYIPGVPVPFSVLIGKPTNKQGLWVCLGDLGQVVVWVVLPSFHKGLGVKG